MLLYYKASSVAIELRPSIARPPRATYFGTCVHWYAADEIVDLAEAGIVDPLAVVCATLIAAVRTASSLLTV